MLFSHHCKQCICVVGYRQYCGNDDPHDHDGGWGGMSMDGDDHS